MNYLLDTDTLIDFIQDRDETRSRIAAMIEAGDEVALCPIIVAEIYSGLSEARRARWDNFIASLPYWHISREAATRAGTGRKAASDAGRTYSVTDSLVAAVAHEHQATVLTSNIKDYRDVSVLSLRNPTRESADKASG